MEKVQVEIRFVTRSLCAFLLIISQTCLADDLSVGPFTFGGMVDVYSGHDFNDPPTNIRPYTTQAIHEDQVNMNLGMVEAKLATDDMRGRLATQFGNSVESNYAAESHLFWRYIQESSFGVKLADKLWLDAGIYPSHIGFESFISRDNWNYTRSLIADYSPYYETGAKLSYEFDEATTGQLHLVRGWQNISNPEDPALGLQLTHRFTDKFQFTYANFFGDVDGQRIYHDFIGKYDISDKLSVALQFDVGSQEQSTETVWWHGWSLMAKYILTPTVALGERIERFSDPHQVVLQTLNGYSFNAVGLSTNIDVELYPKLIWRNEYRVFLGQNAVFPKEDEDRFSKNNQFIVTSLVYSF